MTIRREVLENPNDRLVETTSPTSNAVLEIWEPAATEPQKIKFGTFTTGAGGTPSGPENSVQTSQSGAFLGYAPFKYDESTQQVQITPSSGAVPGLYITTDTAFTGTALLDSFVAQSASNGVAVRARHADTTKTALTVSGAAEFQHIVNVVGTLRVNTLDEYSLAAGVTIDGVLLKNSAVNTNTVNELTVGSGVTIDGVLLKDNNITLTGTVDGRDVSTDGTALDAVVSAAVRDSDFGTNGLCARTSAGTYANRTLTGTTDQITITNGDGVSGNPTFAIASNPTIPGTGGMIPTAGTTAQRVATEGFLRYNTTTQVWEGYDGTTWVDFTTGGAATPGGADTNLQFNTSGTFDGDAELLWNTSTKTLTLQGDLTVKDTGGDTLVVLDPDTAGGPSLLFKDDSAAANRISIAVDDVGDEGEINLYDAGGNQTALTPVLISTDGVVQTDVINEQTATVGVTIDGLLIKDGSAFAAATQLATVDLDGSVDRVAVWDSTAGADKYMLVDDFFDGGSY